MADGWASGRGAGGGGGQKELSSLVSLLTIVKKKKKKRFCLIMPLNLIQRLKVLKGIKNFFIQSVVCPLTHII